MEEVQQPFLQRGSDHRSAPKPHDRHPRRHAASVGEPADQCADWRDVAEPQSTAAQGPIAGIDQPELMCPDADGTDQEAAAPTGRRHRADQPGSDAFQPLAGNRGREAQEHDRDGENPDHVAQRPVVGRGSHHAADSLQGRVEDAPGVDRSDAQVDGHRCGRDQPAVEAGAGDNAVLGKQPRHAATVPVKARKGDRYRTHLIGGPWGWESCSKRLPLYFAVSHGPE